MNLVKLEDEEDQQGLEIKLNIFLSESTKQPDARDHDHKKTIRTLPCHVSFVPSE
jgi:hypothetical protein